MSAPWNTLRECADWIITPSGNQLILKNYAYIEWTDVMEGVDENIRTHRTALEVRMVQDRDVIVESGAVPIQLEDPRVIITRVVYVPGPNFQGDRRLEMDYTTVFPCPITPVFQSVSFALATTDPNTFSLINSTIDASEIGNGVSFAPGSAGEQTSSSVETCAAGQRYYTVTGTIYINLADPDQCYADGTYYFTFGDFAGPATYPLQVTIEDGFNFCAADTLQAGITATLETIGSGPWSVGDKVSFQGNITTTGLPAAQIYLRQAKVYNTKAAYIATRYPKNVFASETTGMTTFGAATAFKSKFVSSYAPGDNVETGTWITQHLAEDTNAATFPAGVARPYLAQVTVFGGTDITTSYLVPVDYGTSGLGFSLELTWRCVSTFL